MTLQKLPKPDTVYAFYEAIHQHFPQISQRADQLFADDWGEFEPAASYIWFEKLAYAVNGEMRRSVAPGAYEELFGYIDSVLESASDEVFTCIDVAFTENLFWQVPEMAALPYWQGLPSSLRRLYLGFHSKPPAIIG